MNLSEMFFLAILGLVIFGPRKLMSAGQEAERKEIDEAARRRSRAALARSLG